MSSTAATFVAPVDNAEFDLESNGSEFYNDANEFLDSLPVDQVPFDEAPVDEVPFDEAPADRTSWADAQEDAEEPQAPAKRTELPRQGTIESMVSGKPVVLEFVSGHFPGVKMTTKNGPKPIFILYLKKLTVGGVEVGNSEKVSAMKFGLFPTRERDGSFAMRMMPMVGRPSCNGKCNDNVLCQFANCKKPVVWTNVRNYVSSMNKLITDSKISSDSVDYVVNKMSAESTPVQSSRPARPAPTRERGSRSQRTPNESTTPRAPREHREASSSQVPYDALARENAQLKEENNRLKARVQSLLSALTAMSDAPQK